MARVYKPLEDALCVAVYRANKGLDGAAKSQKVLAKEYEVGVARIAVSIKRGAELSSVDSAGQSQAVLAAVVDGKVKGKTSTKLKDSGVSGLTMEQIAEIQKRKEEGVSQLQLSRDFGVGRHKIKKALEVVIKDHDNGVKCAGTDHLSSPEEQPIGTLVAFSPYDDRDYENPQPQRYTLVGVSPELNDNDGIIGYELSLAPYTEARETACIVEMMEDEGFRVVSTRDNDEGSDSTWKMYPAGVDMYVSSLIVCLERSINDGLELIMRDGGHIIAASDCDVAKVMAESEFTDTDGLAHMYTDINPERTSTAQGRVEHKDFDEVSVDVRVDHTQENLLDNVSAEAPQCMVLPDQIMIVIDGEPKSIPKDHPNFGALAAAIKAEEWDKAIKLVDTPKAITEFSRGLLTVEKGAIVFDGERITHDGFTKRMWAMLQSGEEANVNRLANFLDKVMDNPSNNIVNRIFDFMKFADVEIAEDGDIIAYKGVRGDYKDDYSGKIANNPGNVVTMRRNRVNEKQEQTCSYGLHVCSLSYLPQMSCFGGSSNKIVRVKLSPTDIVSIPTDYKDAKIRCCRYEVMEDVTRAYQSGQLKIDQNGVFGVAN